MSQFKGEKEGDAPLLDDHESHDIIIFSLYLNMCSESTLGNGSLNSSSYFQLTELL